MIKKIITKFLPFSLTIPILFFFSCNKDSESSSSGPDIAKVQIDSITSIAYSSARIVTTVVSEGKSAVKGMGIAFGKKSNPTVVGDGFLEFDRFGVGTFSLSLQNLESGVTYYVRSYATNASGTFYSEQKSFTTLSLAKVVTKPVSGITMNSVQAVGNISNANSESDITGRGFCWGEDSIPAFYYNQQRVFCGQGSGDFSAKITSLSPGKTYYVWAFASGVKGITFGNPVKFSTLPAPLPILSTTAVSGIMLTSSYLKYSASSGGNITSDGGGGPIIERGIVWGMEPNPISYYYNSTSDGSGTGSFSSLMFNLEPGKTYYVRAFATNENGTAYGNQLTFNTPELPVPVLTTNSVSNITTTSAFSGGNITSSGGSGVITERGVCWSSYPNPEYYQFSYNQTSDGSGTGSFISVLSNLSPNTTYYLRAYAKNQEGLIG